MPTGLQRTCRKNNVNYQRLTLRYVFIHLDARMYTQSLSQSTWTKYTVPGLSPASLQDVWFPTSSITYKAKKIRKHWRAERWRSDHSIKYQWAQTQTQGRVNMQRTKPQTMYRPKHAWTPHCLVAPDQHVYETILMQPCLLGKICSLLLITELDILGHTQGSVRRYSYKQSNNEEMEWKKLTHAAVNNRV